MPVESDLMGLDISCYGERAPERRLDLKPDSGYPGWLEDMGPILLCIFFLLASVTGAFFYFR